jgi:hypothetical protein
MRMPPAPTLQMDAKWAPHRWRARLCTEYSFIQGKYVLVRRLRAVVETSEAEKLRVRVGGREAKAKEACPQDLSGACTCWGAFPACGRAQCW